jgi:HD-GYP domain-containing protein (c-di-GMP phosphodiesterase class II)
MWKAAYWYVKTGRWYSNKQMTKQHEQYYKLIITELAEILPVTTCQDVYSATGLKLVNKDVRIDSTFADKLGQHDILPPLEQCLVVENGIEIEQLVTLARNLMQTRPPLMRIAEKLQDTDVLFDTLRQVSLSEPMIFLLTLARERRLSLLVHSVTVALVCLYLGIRRGLGPQQMRELATAGLFHDIGELRIDEQLLREDAHPLPVEREHIYTHPATSQRMLLNSSIYSLEIVNAVMRHHECLDGSGFPFGLMGSEMGELAKILSIAELAVSKLDKEAMDGKPRLELALKFNMQKYDAELFGYLSVLFGNEPQDLSEVPTLELVDPEEIRMQIGNINLALEFWRRLIGDLPVRPRSPSAYIQQRLSSLSKAMREVGIDIADSAGVIDSIGGDEASLAELYQVNQETLRQITETIFEVQRRWPHYQDDQTLVGQAVSGWMEYLQGLLLENRERTRPAV